MRESIFDELVDSLSKLQGVGKKTARRYAYNILSMSSDDAKRIAESIKEAKEKIKSCTICGNYTENEVCDICLSRDKSVICCVADVRDLIAMEQSHCFNGVYHVLGGLINPMKGIGPSDLRINQLLSRIDDKVSEVIMATGINNEGVVTAKFISDRLKSKNVKVTSLAQGISFGLDLEYADDITMQIALNNRKEIY